MITATNRWWEKGLTVGNFIAGFVMMVVGLSLSVYNLAATNERRWADNDKLIAIIKDRQDFVLMKNQAQDERINRADSEQHLDLEKMVAQLESIVQRLVALEVQYRLAHGK